MGFSIPINISSEIEIIKETKKGFNVTLIIPSMDKKNAKKTDGNKNKNIRGIPKLVDANFAGTSKSNETMLLLCEGDSAKAGILSGLSTQDRNIIGVYPMRGKLFNVRGENQKRINDSKEITEIKIKNHEVVFIKIDKENYLKNKDQFIGFNGIKDKPNSILIKNNNLHIDILIDPNHSTGKIDKAICVYKVV